MMNALTDPIKIVLCGGYSTGKTCILRRLCNLLISGNYEPTAEGNIAVFNIPFSSTTIKLTVIDIAANLLYINYSTSPLVNLLCDVQAACIVVDCSSKPSLKEADQWLELLDERAPQIKTKYLLANKADIPSKVVSSQQLDSFCHLAGFDWAFTVPHPMLGDIDCMRGYTPSQKTIHEVIIYLMRYVLHERQSDYYKLLSLPVSLNLVTYQQYECQDQFS
jgi:GTPase SAR1 family protein